MTLVADASEAPGEALSRPRGASCWARPHALILRRNNRSPIRPSSVPLHPPNSPQICNSANCTAGPYGIVPAPNTPPAPPPPACPRSVPSGTISCPIGVSAGPAMMSTLFSGQSAPVMTAVPSGHFCLSYQTTCNAQALDVGGEDDWVGNNAYLTPPPAPLSPAAAALAAAACAQNGGVATVYMSMALADCDGSGPSGSGMSLGAFVNTSANVQVRVKGADCCACTEPLSDHMPAAQRPRALYYLSLKRGSDLRAYLPTCVLFVGDMIVSRGRARV